MSVLLPQKVNQEMWNRVLSVGVIFWSYAQLQYAELRATSAIIEARNSTIPITNKADRSDSSLLFGSALRAVDIH